MEHIKVHYIACFSGCKHPGAYPQIPSSTAALRGRVKVGFGMIEQVRAHRHNKHTEGGERHELLQGLSQLQWRLVLGEDMYGRYRECLQCGYQTEADRVAGRGRAALEANDKEGP